MIKIAVVDDEKEEREKLCEYYARLSKEIREELEVSVFSSGDELLEKYVDIYDLYCLDIDMKGRDGISTAKEIRAKGSSAVIIFITNMAQMAIRGYEVQAFDFVLKPVNYYSFAMKMQTAVSIINSKKCRNLVISSNDEIRKISTDDLYYIEVSGHYLYYHTKTGNVRQKVSLKAIEEKLAGLPFKRCNNCYLINLKYVDCVEKDELRVGGEWLKISRPRKNSYSHLRIIWEVSDYDHRIMGKN